MQAMGRTVIELRASSEGLAGAFAMAVCGSGQTPVDSSPGGAGGGSLEDTGGTAGQGSGDALAFKNPDGSTVTILYNAGRAEKGRVGGEKLQVDILGNGWATVNGRQPGMSADTGTAVLRDSYVRKRYPRIARRWRPCRRG